MDELTIRGIPVRWVGSEEDKEPDPILVIDPLAPRYIEGSASWFVLSRPGDPVSVPDPFRGGFTVPWPTTEDKDETKTS